MKASKGAQSSNVMTGQLQGEGRRNTMRGWFKQFREQRLISHHIDTGAKLQERAQKLIVPPLPKKDQVSILSRRNRLTEFEHRYNRDPKLHSSMAEVQGRPSLAARNKANSRSAVDLQASQEGSFHSAAEEGSGQKKPNVPFLLYGPADKAKTPGPSSYNIVYGDIQDRLAKGKGATFKGKNYPTPAGSLEETPGPAAYATFVQREKRNAFSIGRGRRVSVSKSKSPGPGEYQADRPSRIKGTVVFSSVQKPSSQNDIPGPGQYEAASVEKRAPKYLFPTSKRFHLSAEDLNSTIGPQSYFPNYDVYLPKRKAVIFPTAKRATSLSKETGNTQSGTNLSAADLPPDNKSSRGVSFATEKRFRDSQVVIR
jgi:hypothetical protein